MASGAQIRASRVLLGWTPRDLAHMANVCVFTVNQIERIEGPGRYPGLATIEAHARQTSPAPAAESWRDVPKVILRGRDA
jgi:transcriptional regulator with XRE-family HTH domain